MTTGPIKVFIVDDSAFMRQMIALMLEKDPHIKVVGRARNGKEALEKIPSAKPDVVTMDVEMPVMDGLQTLTRLMEVYPVPVVMVSSLTHEGALTTIRALELGAVDFIPKPSKGSEIGEIAQSLVGKIKLASTVDVRAGIKGIRRVPLSGDKERDKIVPGSIEAVVIGTSTGGPAALQQVVPKLPQDSPPVIIVQHMPKGFTKALAERLDRSSVLAVKEAEDGDVLKRGTALVAPAGKQMVFQRRAGGVSVHLTEESPVPTLFKPSVDVVMLSAAEIFKDKVLGVVMTGMGSDGVRGLKKIKEYGGKALAESEETCIVYGMPKSAVEAGVVDEIQPLYRLAERISEIAAG
ncbi:MAG TPA: chemotaxis response regulator protein-glutamate methylesterase [Peptococcaceae bacterium]|nr:MAG: Chemotaxis response regulator protein-glutamate methylesterase [Clostridia bacterium 41_269]HBT20199.1 chemotaxis response regulator protein-glutamate methylesterase [Peptococcaceae bacterium]